MPERPDVRERARIAFEIWNEQGIAAMAERSWHPDIVWEEPEHFPDAAVRRGREECVRRMSERFSLLGEVELELVDAEELRDDLMLIEAIVHARGTERGAPIATREFFLMDNVDGLAIRFREFLDRDRALAAANEH